MRKSSYLGPFTAIALCAVAVWMYFTPHLAVRRLQQAAEAGDRQALERMVDFPAVRASVKHEVRDALREEISRKAERNPFAALGAAFAGVLVDPLVDSFVTPSGIASAVRGERPSLRRERGEVKEEAKKLELSQGYEGTDTFVLHFRDRESGKERMALVMRRDGLAEWKLSAIRLAGGAEE